MKLFLGLIFILLDVEIAAGSGTLNLIPDFIGYFLLMKGLEERSDPWRHMAFGLFLTGLALFAADLLVKDTAVQVILWFVELAAEIAMLVLARRVIGQEKRLRELFPVLCCIRILTMLLGWVPLVGNICGAANLVVAACFLIAAYNPMTKE